MSWLTLGLAARRLAKPLAAAIVGAAVDAKALDGRVGQTFVDLVAILFGS
jgi:hypothetical protein